MKGRGHLSREENQVRFVRLLLFGANCLAAFSISLACFAPPDHFFTFLGVFLSCSLVLTLGMYIIRAQPLLIPALFLAPIIILVGAIIGLISISQELKNNWTILFGNLFALGTWETSIRFSIAFISISTLGILCPLRSLAQWLSIFAFSGPGLLWLYLAQGQVKGRLPKVEIWQIQAIVLVSFLILLIIWTVIDRKLLLLEKMHNRIGRRLIPSILRLENPASIHRYLNLTDGWLDPLHKGEKSIQALMNAKHLSIRQNTFTKAFELLNSQTYILSPSDRQKLDMATAHKPEAAILLAGDDFLRKQFVNGSLRVASLMNELAPETTWLIEAVQTLWQRYRPTFKAEVQQSLWNKIVAQSVDGRTALSALAAIVLEQGLSPELARFLSAQAESAKSIDAHFLLACHDAHMGKMEEALPGILLQLPAIPQLITRNKLLPNLGAVTQTDSLIQKHSFFLKDARPQLLEMVERPLTSIYGSRITCWTFYQPLILNVGSSKQLSSPILPLGRALQRPVRFAVTGHGPGPVCASVSAIVNNLASERNCPSDLILAGMAFFDLTATVALAHQPEGWNQNELERRIREIAGSFGVEEVISTKRARDILARFVQQRLQPTINTTQEALAQIEIEKGFVVNQDIQAQEYEAAHRALSSHMNPSVNHPFPVLTEYLHHGRFLEVKLPRLCLGIEDYDHVVNAYRRSVHQEMRQEWERRQRKYEEWSRQFITRFHRHRAQLSRSGQATLAARVMYVSFAVDPETATETRYDPPKPITEWEDFNTLPATIVNQLAYWAWASYKIDALPQEEEFRPHWELSCLVDAFLRDWPLPTEDAKLNAAREAWQQNWRSLALVALEISLKDQGISLADIAVENTIFRVVNEDDEYLTLRLYHIWDPYYDSLPESKAGASVFHPSFGKRQRNLLPSVTTQQQAVTLMKRVLAGVAVLPVDLQRALTLDSGDAFDLLVEHLSQPFMKDDLADEIKRVMQKASEKIDPLVSFGLLTKLNRCSTLHELLLLAKQCSEQGQRDKTVPDFWSWELYLIGRAIQQAIANIGDQWRDETPLIFNEISPMQSSRQLPPGVNLPCIHTMATYGPWAIVLELVQQGPCVETIKAILAFLEFPDLATKVHASYKYLDEYYPDYINQCLASDGPPPTSVQRKTEYAPTCLQGWERICYDIAEGDAGLELAWLIRTGAGTPDQDLLATLLTQIKHLSIHDSFEQLILSRHKLCEELEKFHRQKDQVSRSFAGAAVRQALRDTLAGAETAYWRAAATDEQYGCGWLRLARLKWLTAQYREAFSLLVGPRPVANLQACQLPLAIAIKAAGGSFSLSETTQQLWADLSRVASTVSRLDDNKLILDFAVKREQLESEQINPTLIGRLMIESLSPIDTDLLQEFFQKYQPSMFKSAETDHFETWVRLIRVPNLGLRASVAKALGGETEFALLAAGVYLGVPAVLRYPDTLTLSRPAEWLEMDVVTALEWRAK